MRNHAHPEADEPDIELLKKHLQALIQVEFFTIPFYLTGAYSFTDAALNYPGPDQSYPLYRLQQQTLSVVMQEMYHLQLAANLANAFDLEPEIPALTLIDGIDIAIPHLERQGRPLTARIGNLPTIIESLIAGTRPGQKPVPLPAGDVVYGSITNLHHATLLLTADYLDAYAEVPPADDPHFIPDHKQVAYGAFAERYRCNAIATRADVARAINAIVDQGGGGPPVALAGEADPQRTSAARLARHFSFGNNGLVASEHHANAGSRFASFDHFTQLRRLEDVLAGLQSQDWSAAVGGPVFHRPNGRPSPDLPGWAPGREVLQASLNTLWSYLVDQLQIGFQTGRLGQTDVKPPSAPGFDEAMFSFRFLPTLIWQSGFVPHYVYRTGVSAADMRRALDAADPRRHFHGKHAGRRTGQPEPPATDRGTDRNAIRPDTGPANAGAMLAGTQATGVHCPGSLQDAAAPAPTDQDPAR